MNPSALLPLPVLFTFTATFLAASTSTDVSSVSQYDVVKRHLSVLSDVFPDAVLALPSKVEARRVEQAPEQPDLLRLAPIWSIRIPSREETSSYLMWESSGSGELVEFAFGAVAPSSKFGELLTGVPSLQQFPVSGESGKPVASGCVPTAGASMVGYWVSHGCAEWAGTPTQKPTEAMLQDYTMRLRARIRMVEIQDTVGYTDNGMSLSGAFPWELAFALEHDARAVGAGIKTSTHRYNHKIFKREISAQRPVLLSCQVRLPQKPHLSWGHEVIGVGWLEVNGNSYVGIKDNFFPCSDKNTVRWIRDEAFETMVFVRRE